MCLATTPSRGSKHHIDHQPCRQSHAPEMTCICQTSSRYLRGGPRDLHSILQYPRLRVPCQHYHQRSKHIRLPQTSTINNPTERWTTQTRDYAMAKSLLISLKHPLQILPTATTAERLISSTTLPRCATRSSPTLSSAAPWSHFSFTAHVVPESCPAVVLLLIAKRVIDLGQFLADLRFANQSRSVRTPTLSWWSCLCVRLAVSTLDLGPWQACNKLHPNHTRASFTRVYGINASRSSSAPFRPVSSGDEQSRLSLGSTQPTSRS